MSLSRLQEFHTEIAALFDEQRGWQNEKDQLLRKIAGVQQESLSMRNRADDEKRALQEQLARVEREVRHSNERARLLEQKLADASADLDEHAEDRRREVGELQEKLKAEAAKAEDARRWSSLAEEARAKYMALHSSYSKLTACAKDLEKTTQEQQDQLSALHATQSQAESRQQQLEEKLRRAMVDNASLQADLNVLKTQHERQIATMQGEHQQEIASFAVQGSEHRKQEASFKAFKMSAVSRIESLQKHIQSIQQSFRSRWEAEIAERTKREEELRKRVAQLEVQLKIPTEQLPPAPRAPIVISTNDLAGEEWELAPAGKPLSAGIFG